MTNRIIKKLRNIIIGDYRSKILADIIVKRIIKFNKQKNIKILDFGSGFQPNIIFFIYNKLSVIHKKKVVINCYDFYTSKKLYDLNSSKTSPINFKKVNLLKRDKIKYDFTLINDVLHHIGIDEEKLNKNLLNSILDKSKIIFIKDHFQSGPISNFVIRLMDFFGNYFNNVKTPKLYYTKKTFKDFIGKTNGKIIEIVYKIKLYPSYTLFMSNPKFNFFCLIKKN